MTGGTTVPQIIIDEKPIGGYDNLMALVQSGELNFE
jgi:glutaredoxin